ncbi:MAG: hypothetical protein LBE92_01760 [Chryseobacterium sp.]|jgi:hypothetical protein|uniref:hypothetical protein n=1 Tax=Chryseobacterium sp. TaxID=1871047 RepID=UPI002819F2B0|nr:hypothetical protein [Chryseobacterium sp.]MDR2234824.1 hypothetical protein [Chryseobacterium sp.]
MTEKKQDIAEIMKGCSITAGIVRYHDLCYLSLVDNEQLKNGHKHSFDMELDMGIWGCDALNWVVVSEAVIHYPQEKCIRLGEFGHVKTSGGGEITIEKEITANGGPQKRGPLREVNAIDGKAYAVGTCRQVYVRTDKDQWQCLDKTAQIYENDDEEYDKCFESVAGFSDHEVYCAGWDGDLWRYDGEQFRKIELGITSHLTKIRTASDGMIYGCGMGGVVIRGRGDQWKVFKTGHEDLWGLVEFNDKIYISSLHALYEWVDKELIPVDFGDDIYPASCYHLSAAEGIMWSIGGNDVLEFNGETWKRILRL